MTIDQFNQAKRIEEEVGELMHCLKCCKAAINPKRIIDIAPTTEPYCLDEIPVFKLPLDISEAIMTKAIELLTERIKELEEEFKQL